MNRSYAWFGRETKIVIRVASLCYYFTKTYDYDYVTSEVGIITESSANVSIRKS